MSWARRGGGALAVRRDAGVRPDLAAGIDADGRLLPRPEAADLDVRRQADAHQLALSGGLLLLLAEAGVAAETSSALSSAFSYSPVS